MLAFPSGNHWGETDMANHRGLRQPTAFWRSVAQGSALAKPALALRRLGAPDGLVRLALRPAVASRAVDRSLREHRMAHDAQLLGRLGSLEARLAREARELREAQRLRYRVFYEEMSARADILSAVFRRDSDRFDRICDHILVVDRTCASPSVFNAGPKVVGTYRLLRQNMAERNFGFYTQNEFDIAPLIAAHPGKRFLELGRSCVLRDYRDKPTLELLWRAIHAYVLRHRIDVLMGCASLEGTDPSTVARQLSFLHHYAPRPEGWRVRALPERYVPMDVLPKSRIDAKAALRDLPPLIKGYLRLGAYIGEGAVVDHQFGTTDVLVLLPMSAVAERYRQHLAPLVASRAA